MKANSEDVVQAALTVERWCREHKKAAHDCDCPFYIKLGIGFGHCALWQGPPYVGWGLEKFLRTRGLKHDD
jgi:hypothetical protein